MTKNYDLHCHSNVSDGIFSPEEIVQRAVEQKVEVLALTDHDTVQGVSRARLKAQELGLELISGVEISTVWENKGIHIVGLNFDENHPAMLALLAKQTEIRQQRARDISKKLEKIDVFNALEGAQALTTGDVTRAHFARYLVQIGKVKDMNQAFKKYLGNGKTAYVKTQWCDIETAINVIHQAGGLAVLAHPLRYKLTTRWVRKLVEAFKQWGGDALEVAGCGQQIDQRRFLAKLAQEHQLWSSVGSDFHSPCAWIELGRSLQLPLDSQPIWHAW